MSVAEEEPSSAVAPPPKLVLQTSSSDEDLLGASFDVTHTRKRFGSIRSKGRSSMSSASNIIQGDDFPVNGTNEVEDSLGFRDFITARTRRSRTLESVEVGEIRLSDSRSQIPAEETESKDIFRWAVMYENQRGATLFGLSSYSSSSLLPNDPPAFTLPPTDAEDPESMITPHTLEDYQLPDASWVWVSKTWLVHMGGNGSSHDGFHYNWRFRTRGWRAAPGIMSAGGWVRRRQWVRLMLRPAIIDPYDKEIDDTGSNHRNEDCNSVTSMIWTGNSEKDWVAVQQHLHELETDGLRISAWRNWLLGPSSSEDGTISLSSKDDGSTAPNPQIQKRAQKLVEDRLLELLDSFIFPQSRQLFIALIRSLNIPLIDVQGPDFYSVKVLYWDIENIYAQYRRLNLGFARSNEEAES